MYMLGQLVALDELADTYMLYIYTEISVMPYLLAAKWWLVVQWLVEESSQPSLGCDFFHICRSSSQNELISLSFSLQPLDFS